MHSVILQLDDALERQPTLSLAIRDSFGQVILARDLGPALRLWSRSATLSLLRDRVRAATSHISEPIVVFAGSGDFHHITSLLVERAVSLADEPTTILHFDNHPDWARFARGRHCGSWVGEAARLPGVAKIITVGVCSEDIGRKRSAEGDLALIDERRLDLYAWVAPDGTDCVSLNGQAWPTVAAMGEAAFIAHLAAKIRTRSVYVTIDKDVLIAADALTNWDQGQASLDFVVSAIEAVAAGRRILGADVVGDWSTPSYGDGAVSSIVKRAEALLDQPWTWSRPAAADRINEAANLRLLNLFQGHA